MIALIMENKKKRKKKNKKQRNLGQVSGGQHRRLRTQRILVTVFAMLIVISLLLSVIVSRGGGF